MTRLGLFATSVAVAALLGYAVWFVPAIAQTTQLGPLATGCLITGANASTSCVLANPSRKLLTLCNVSASPTIWVAPAPTVPAANGIGSISIPPVSSGTTTCINIPAVTFGQVTGGIGAAWNAVASATPATLSVLDYGG
jgi:hypothetical protein